MIENLTKNIYFQTTGEPVPHRERTSAETKTRVAKYGEMFTPAWVCKKQTDLVDNCLHRDYPDWKAYVAANVLEMTCGEAPYLVFKVYGDLPLADRAGLLDDKLAVVSEHCDDAESWRAWALTALKATYGFELQGDNLYLARLNVLETVKDYHAAKFNAQPPEDFVSACAEIICLNLWQMDGLTYLKEPPSLNEVARVKDWQTGEMVAFTDLLDNASKVGA